ncbi:MAG: hypothetical protein JW915_23265 [Chitinispirillaceae bacterium]|nr:hypothetical protein [Chitinispirillaceae bacterium]
MSRFIVSNLVLLLVGLSPYCSDTGYVLNKGTPGNITKDLLVRVYRDVIVHKPDVVVLLIGTNDLLNTRKMVSMTEYYKNIEQLADSLLSHNIHLVVVSPPTVDTLYLYQRHDASLYPAPPLQLLESARDTIETLCLRKNLLFVDLFTHLMEMGVPLHEEDYIIRNRMNSGESDGIHFTIEGNRLLAQLVYGKLKENFGELRNLKIICFGDSITFGVYMKGRGTAEGDTYPAVLKRLIHGKN